MNSYPTQFFRITTFSFALMLTCLWSCNQDEPLTDNTEQIDYGYTISIESPSESSIYSFGDTLPISIMFSSTTGEIVHNIGVEIYDKSSKDIYLYSVQSHQHVPDFFHYMDDFVLKDTSKIEFDEEWILKASMWSHELMGDTVSIENEMLIKR